jgi:hypothetical protein
MQIAILMLSVPFAGSQLDLPSLVTPSQLETLLNGLLANEEKLPYSFHIEDQVWRGN